MSRAPTGQEGTEQRGGRGQVRKEIYGQEGTDRSGGPCTVGRVPTCQEDAER